MDGLFDISGKTALVTGGSRGIGLMIARGLLEAGAHVIVSSRKTADLEASAQELAAIGDCQAIQGDVSTPDGATALAAQTRERFAQLDILINNAGVTWGAPLEEFPASAWERTSHTNIEGVFHLTVALLPALRAAADADDPARVVNIGSIDGLRTPELENFSYSASKQGRHLAAHRTIDDVADRLLHADLAILAKLSCALARARAVPLAA